nr:MDIS1-interacting receptor like kinase 1-like [Aegilops tauschii subsp. strangulata]
MPAFQMIAIPQAKWLDQKIDKIRRPFLRAGKNSVSGGKCLDEFWKLPKLRTLILSGNKPTGAIPASLSNVTTLTRNYLQGTIPRNLSSNLYRLRLGGNKLNGTIPDTIGDVLALAYLELENNHLMGNISSELGKCRDLSLLNLASNNFQGQVPDAISTLDKLIVLKLQMNNLRGSIPSTFSDLTSLDTLNLSLNSFTGEIPTGIFNLPKLFSLNFQGNNISGAIPVSVSTSQSLIELNLANNSLTGTIPTMPTSLSKALNLGHNHLTGSIPSNIGVLKDLEILDLSYNNLSGPVPSSLDGLQSLTQLVLSYNHLSGSLPAFRSSVTVDSTGNSDLTDGEENSDASPTSGKTSTQIDDAIVGSLFGLWFITILLAKSANFVWAMAEPDGRARA